MKIFIFSMVCCFLLLLQSGCKKKKLENPLGAMQLDSDTSLAEGRYVIRTAYSCSGNANAITSASNGETYSMNGIIYPNDDLSGVDAKAFWYVKKVRYADNGIAFGYRIYQQLSNDTYNFFCMMGPNSPTRWETDAIGDGGGNSLVMTPFNQEYYPVDPPVPTYFGSGDDPNDSYEVSPHYLFQFYRDNDHPENFQIRTLGGKYWKFSTALWDVSACDNNAQVPHFRSIFDNCENVDDLNGSKRCYIDNFYFQKIN